ncbi:MAG TPA: MBL fold metallo-hydrolase, partial [Labilithrix sp.]|nr:MBL fold metallo-hydrolase [Labilithrix sp.]
MKIHHLNLCTLCPVGGRLVSAGPRSILEPGELFVHALLVETDKDGLVLVDTGMGLEDVRSPIRRLGASFVMFARPRLREEDTAARQVERLGFKRSDVRHIVVTHLDKDHAGGISDFPDATVHVHRREHAAAMRSATSLERVHYRKAHLVPGPKWSLHDGGGDSWFGFESLRVIAEDVLLVPLPGHTRGHSGVAVRTGDRAGPEFLLHCGDAYFFHLEKDDPECCPPALKHFQARTAVDDAARRANAKRIRELYRQYGGIVRPFSAHCPHEFRALADVERDRSGRLPS